MFYYSSKRNDEEVIRKLQDLAEKKPNEGQDKFYDRIREEGLLWNYKRVRRVYRLLGMHKRKRTRKRIPSRVKTPLSQPGYCNKNWSIDFMSDALQNGRKFRTLNIIDDYNRKALWIEPAFSMPSKVVTKILEQAIREHGKPETIRSDNGPEFISADFTDWCKSNGIMIQYIQPGKPMQNGFIERFNRTYRQDVLDANLFEDLMQVRILTEEWMEDYNYQRPHESLGGKPPAKFRAA